jgi:hypothetical protein
METLSLQRLAKLIGCALAVFTSPATNLTAVMLGCMSIPHHDS